MNFMNKAQTKTFCLTGITNIILTSAAASLLMAGCNAQDNGSSPLPTATPPMLLAKNIPSDSCLNQLSIPSNQDPLPDNSYFDHAWIDGEAGTYRLISVQWAVRDSRESGHIDFMATSGVYQNDISVHCINNELTQVRTWTDLSSFPYEIDRTDGAIKSTYQVTTYFDATATTGAFDEKILPATEMTQFEELRVQAKNAGGTLHVYLNLDQQLQIYVDSSSTDGSGTSQTRVIATYQLVNTQNPHPIETQTPAPTPTPTQMPAPTPDPTPTSSSSPTVGKNVRCEIANNYLRIDHRNAVYFDDNSDLMTAYTQLLQSGFCSENSRLSLQNNYIRLDGLNAFYSDDSKALLQDLMTLYQAGAGSTTNSRCRIRNNFIRMNDKNATYYDDSTELMNVFLKLLKTPGACNSL